MNAIAAISDNFVIGSNNQLPWHIPEDLAFFKATTLGQTIVMGRKTFESIGSKPLPKRLNIVISKTLNTQNPPPGVIIVQNIHELANYPTQGEIFIIGGATLYEATLKNCKNLYITHIKGHYEGDTFFPPFSDQFKVHHIIQETEKFKIIHYQHI